MAQIDWEVWCKDLDALIQKGGTDQARSVMNGVDLTKVPRKFSVSVAALTYRLNLPLLGLRILRKLDNPTLPEQAEYALGLIRVGAEDEALKLLLNLNAELYPTLYFYRSSLHVARWEYEAAVPLLLRYLEFAPLTQYQRVVAQMNLAAGFIYTKKPNTAKSVLEEIRAAAAQYGYDFAMGKAMQLEAENALYQKDWKGVESAIAEAKKFIRDHAGMDDFFIRKLELQYKAEFSKGSTKVLAEIAVFRKEAENRRHWETIRDLDKTIAVTTNDKELYLKLFFGTPLLRFRKQLVEDFGSNIPPNQTYDWTLAEGKNPFLLDISADSLGAGKDKIQKSHLLFKILRFAASDLYRPFRVASLHYFLYPNLKFDTVSSRPRIHRALARLREWLDAIGCPLEIVETDEFYILKATGALTLRLPYPKALALSEPEAIEVLQDQFGDRPFSTSDAGSTLKKPLRTVSRLLLEAMQEGVIEKQGKGPATKYSFKKTA